MNKIKIYFLALVILFISNCNSQITHNLKIDANKVSNITIENKVYCCFRTYNGKRVEITSKNKINNIIVALNDCRNISQSEVHLNSNNGYFRISFEEGDVDHSYDVVYTVYDGIVILNNNGGDCYKNDQVEIRVQVLF